MSVKKFIDYLKSVENIETQDIENIKQSIKLKKCKKNEILISNNQICDKVFFVISGLLRTFYIDEKGVEKTRLISIENMFCSNWASFYNQSENNEFIQSLENSEVIYINHQNFYELVNKSQRLNKIYTRILEEHQVYNIKRFEFISNLSLLERIREFEKYYPKIQSRISNKVLASFLYTTPEHCSFIKKTIITKTSTQ